MPPYDSESSGLEDADYTETNVLLGFASREPTEDTISRLGGQPTWLDPTHPPSAALARCKICRDHMRLLLQLNGDLPERYPGHERRLYVFGCDRMTCKRKEGCIRAFRGTRADLRSHVRARSGGDAIEDNGVDQGKMMDNGNGEAGYDGGDGGPGHKNLGNDLFGSKKQSLSSIASSSANPFSTSTDQSSTTNPFSTAPAPSSILAAKPSQRPVSDDLSTSFAAKVSLQQPASSSLPGSHQEPQRSTFEPWPSAIDNPSPPYPSYYLEADYETLDTTPLSSGRNEAIDQDSTTTADTSSKEEKEQAFESNLDHTFQRFADRLAQNPLQALRYDFGGSPLLYSKRDRIGQVLSGPPPPPPPAPGGGEASTRHHHPQGSRMTRCGNCGAHRVFELQLTPHAIVELEVDEEGYEGMEWGTIILAVCEKDCVPSSVTGEGQVGYVEEWVGVQWEEVGGRG